MGSQLPLTGERTVPGIPEENYWFRRHEAAYQFALALADDQTVAEIGCGEGYGTARLAERARRTVGIDYDRLTVLHAAATYRTPRFVRANLAALPLRGAAVDMVASLQVIEHVWDHGQFLAECRRVLRPGGLLLLTTPNRLTFSPGLNAPVNPFHTVEFTARELADLVHAHGFSDPQLYGLHRGPHLEELDARYGSFADAQLATAPQEWPERLRSDVASITAGDFLIIDSRAGSIDASLDLVLTSRSSGEH